MFKGIPLIIGPMLELGTREAGLTGQVILYFLEERKIMSPFLVEAGDSSMLARLLVTYFQDSLH